MLKVPMPCNGFSTSDLVLSDASKNLIYSKKPFGSISVPRIPGDPSANIGPQDDSALEASNHSYLRATIGSTFVARRAGM